MLMAHRALALKYRPQVFADLVGQEHVSAVLQRAVETGRVAHAYLFTGARGVGKTTSARILAKALNCERRAAGKHKGADPCNACTSCTEITQGVSLDVAEIDGASNRGIADVQALREKVRFAPTGGKYRVVIIDEVHQLSNDAFAALLKTLEEPPAHLVFIFATTDPQKLPDTIRSRTQRFDFARVPLRKVADRLLDIAKREKADPDGVKVALTEGAALLMAQKSEGSMRDAVSALDQVVSSGEKDVNEELVRRVLGIADREAFFALADAITKRDPRAALAALHAGFTKGLDPRDLLDGLGEHIRHLLVLAVDPAAEDLIPASQDDLKRMRAQSAGWSEHDLLRLLRLVTEAAAPMKDSPQPLVHLEAVVLQMATLEPGEALATLLARLEALEQRLAGGAPPSTTAAPSPAGRGTSRPGTPVRNALAGAAAPAAPMRAPVAPVMRATPASAPVPPRADAPRATNGAAVVGPAPAAVTPAAAALPVTSDEPLGVALAVEDEVAGPPVIGPVAGQVTEPDGATRWQALVGRVNEKKPLLGAFLAESAFVAIEGDSLVVAMDDLHRAVVDDKENRALVAAEIPRLFGRAFEIRCVAPQERLARRRPTAEEVQPAIERAIAWCDGEIIEGTGRGAERSTNG
jgi:DNA polymerase-3 subunit gamma/tau